MMDSDFAGGGIATRFFDLRFVLARIVGVGENGGEEIHETERLECFVNKFNNI